MKPTTTSVFVLPVRPHVSERGSLISASAYLGVSMALAPVHPRDWGRQREVAGGRRQQWSHFVNPCWRLFILLVLVCLGLPASAEEPKAISQVQSTLPCADRPNQGPEMVLLPGGEFLMGVPKNEAETLNSERPQHRVTVAAFAMSRCEITFAQYDAFATATGRKLPRDEEWGRGQRPVINVTWEDATAYTQWLSKQTGESYRLPTEAEWEYAARAGTTTPFYTGACITSEQANYNGEYDYNNCGAKTGLYRKKTIEVDALPQPANPWGLYHMAGNVWEWTQDCWHEDYTNAPSDSKAWAEGQGGDCASRVLRGGSWINNPRIIRSAIRIWNTTNVADIYVGFRVARTL